MGYSVDSIKGSICFKENTPENIIDAFDNALQSECFPRYAEVDGCRVLFNGYSELFDGVSFYDTLRSVSEYVEEPSEVCCEDDVGYLWRYRFDAETGEWLTEEGCVKYTTDKHDATIAEALRLYAAQGEEQCRAAKDAATGMGLKI